jgi:hypothetical protein
MLVEMDGEDYLALRRVQQQEELERYRRLIRFMVLLLVFWCIMLYCIANREDGLAIAGIVIMLFWIIYMCTCIFGNVCLRFQEQTQEHEPLGQDEERGLTAASDNTNEESIHDDGIEDPSSPLRGPFEETLERIRACTYPISPGKAPTNGTYTAVFSSVFLGKAIRSEGKLRLQFSQTDDCDNGWGVNGESLFSGKAVAIQDGFVNSRGDMYWKTGSTIHRGNLDFSSSSMFDGEFKARLHTPITSPPIGRIVRLELAKASFYSSTVEMITVSAKGDGADDGVNHAGGRGAFR